MKNEIVALIPARGGSKGVKNKNLQIIDTVPLIAHTILEASKVKEIAEVVVSSDSNEILEQAELYGATPLERPKEFATDEASTESVIEHFLQDAACATVVLIQPTSTMLRAEDLQKGLDLYYTKKYDTIFSGYRTNDTLVWDAGSIYPLNYDPKNRGTRQTRKRWLVIENGAFYIFPKKRFLENKSRLFGKIGYVEMPFWRSFQIDNYRDLNQVSVLMTRKL